MNQMSKEANILVVLIAGIGDLILGSKSIRSLRKGYPNAMIHLLTSAEAFVLAQNYDFIDHVWAFPIREFQNTKIKIFDILRLVQEIRKFDFDIIMNLYRVSTWTGSLSMGLFFAFLRGREKVGHDNKGFGLFLNSKIPARTFQEKHIADAMAAIAAKAGGVMDDIGIDVFYSSKSKDRLGHLFPENLETKSKINIAINPGGNRPNRRWDPKKFALLAHSLVRKYDARIFLLGGPGEEEMSETIQGRIKDDCIDLSGRLTLDDLVYIISKVNLLITNDSAPMHIAAAAKTPVVAVFGPEDPSLFGPYTSPQLHRIVQKDVDCQPCSKKDCARPLCLDLITPEEVMEKCVELISQSGA
jgi:heptosyltransferase-1